MIARWLAIGFALWLVLTLAFRALGAHPESGAVSWLMMAAPFVTFWLSYLLLAMLKVDVADRAEATGLVALPGLLFGIYEINSFSFVFPDFDPSLSATFATLMFSSYAAAILAGVVSSRLQQGEGASEA